MQLVCEKYNDKMDSEEARCQHPGEYCKFRTSCLIHFIGQGKEREKRLEKADKQGEKDD